MEIELGAKVAVYMKFSAIALVALVAGCTSSSVTPVSQNQFILSTSGAPACGQTGTARVASQMAAVETLRRGYPRYVIVGSGAQNNVSVINTAPTFATTNGTFNRSGNTVYGNSTTTFGGGMTMVMGTNDNQLNVVMLKAGDASYAQGLDAKAQLGEKWAEKVENGIQTCAEYIIAAYSLDVA